MDGQPGCQQNTARPRARAHLCLPGLVTLSTAALGPSLLLGRLTEPTPGAACHRGAQPTLALEQFQADTSLSRLSPVPAGLTLQPVWDAPQTPLWANPGTLRPARHRLPGPGSAWAAVGGAECLQHPGSRTRQGPLAAISYHNCPHEDRTSEKSPSSLVVSPCHPAQSLSVLSGEAQTTNAEPSSALPGLSGVAWVFWEGKTLSSPPSEVFLRIQVSSKIRLFSAPYPSGVQTRMGGYTAAQPPPAVPRAPQPDVQAQTHLST